MCCLHGSAPHNVLTLTCQPGEKVTTPAEMLEHTKLKLEHVSFRASSLGRVSRSSLIPLQVSDLKKQIEAASDGGKRPVDSQVVVAWGEELKVIPSTLRDPSQKRSNCGITRAVGTLCFLLGSGPRSRHRAMYPLAMILAQYGLRPSFASLGCLSDILRHSIAGRRRAEPNDTSTILCDRDDEEH